MLKQLKYKNDVIPGFFISDEGKIYDENRVEQKQKIYPNCPGNPYYFFKGHGVHKMMMHSFQEYKEGYEIHHKNEIKTDNRLENLCYLTRAEHRRLHKIGNKNMRGKKLSEQTKEKIRVANKGKKLSKQTKAKMRASQDKKQVYCLELDKIFPGVNIAAQELCLHQGNICLCCQGKRKTCGGYTWQYYDVDSE